MRQNEEARDSVEVGLPALVQHVTSSILVMHPDGTIRYAGSSIAALLGCSSEDLVATNAFSLVHPDDADRLQSIMRSVASDEGELVYEEFRLHHQDGEWRWLGASVQDLVHEPEIAGLLLHLHDVSKRKQLDADEALQGLLFDKLTGLPNRVLLKDRIERACLAAERAHEPLAIILVNLDRFRDVNDALGHTLGDALLGMVAERLQAALRASDTFARLIGDEFVVLVRASDDLSALMVAERIEGALDAPFMMDDQPIALSATMGISFFPDHGKDGEELLQHADVALQNARALRAPCAVYSSEDDSHTVRRLALRAELRAAIEQDGLVQYYQPKRELRSKRVVGVEALARWAHPLHGFVPPSEFIQLAERWNAIKPLTLWALRTGVQHAKAWEQGGQPLVVSVNLSARDLHDQDVPRAIDGLLTASALDPRLLCLEVTESMLMMDPDRARFVLDQLRSLGLSISIDDFGTGYSSLSYLSRLPIDELKIDSSFVIGMANAERDRLIVETTIELGHRLGLSVTAEGVEDREAEALLAEMGCDLAQGFHICAPVDEAELKIWLTHA